MLNGLQPSSSYEMTVSAKTPDGIGTGAASAAKRLAEKLLRGAPSHGAVLVSRERSEPRPRSDEALPT